MKIPSLCVYKYIIYVYIYKRKVFPFAICCKSFKAVIYVSRITRVICRLVLASTYVKVINQIWIWGVVMEPFETARTSTTSVCSFSSIYIYIFVPSSITKHIYECWNSIYSCTFAVIRAIELWRIRVSEYIKLCNPAIYFSCGNSLV